MQNLKLLVTLKSTLKWPMLQLFLINEAQLHSFITRAFNNSQNKSTVLLLKVYPTTLHRFKNARSVTNLMLSRNILSNQTPKVSEMTLTMETMTKSKKTSDRVTSEKESLYNTEEKEKTSNISWMNKERGEKRKERGKRSWPCLSCRRLCPFLSCSLFLSFSPHAVLNRQAACILSHKVITAPLGLFFFPLLLFLSLSQSLSSLSPVFPPPFPLTVLLALPLSLHLHTQVTPFRCPSWVYGKILAWEALFHSSQPMLLGIQLYTHTYACCRVWTDARRTLSPPNMERGM